jgi:hypothetical protein
VGAKTDGPPEPGTDGPQQSVSGQPGPGRTGRWIRSIEAAAIAGVAYAILAVVGLVLLSRFPDLNQTDEQISAWFDDPANRTGLVLGLNLIAISSIAFLWFVAVIRRRLGELEDRFFGTVFFGSSIALVVVWLASAAALASPAVAITVHDGASVSHASASSAAGLGAAFLLVVAPRIQAVFVITTSTLFLRSRVLPRWLAIAGYLIALAMFVVPLIVELVGLGFPIWVFVVSVVVLFHRPPTTRDDITSRGNDNQPTGRT